MSKEEQFDALIDSYTKQNNSIGLSQEIVQIIRGAFYAGYGSGFYECLQEFHLFVQNQAKTIEIEFNDVLTQK